MSIIRYSVGVDVSKDNFHVAVLTTNDARAHKTQRSNSFDNAPAGFESFIKWCRKEHKQPELPLAIAMEATGTYHERLALALHLAGFIVHIVLPNRAKAYIASFSTGSKTDKADARDLARMCAEQPLDRWNPPGDFFYTLRTLTRHYQSIQELITATRNQLHALEVSMKPLQAVIDSQQHLIEVLETQLKEIKAAIGKQLRSDKAIWKRAQHAISIPGIALLTAAVVLAETDGFELFKNVGQLVSYAGYDVIENQSGSHVGRTRISKRGNSRLRRALHMCSLVTITTQTPSMVALYERTFGRHGIKMKSYVAIQKKLLILIYTLWKKEQDFDADYKPGNTQGEQPAAAKWPTDDKEAGHSSRDSEPRDAAGPGKKIALAEQG